MDFDLYFKIVFYKYHEITLIKVVILVTINTTAIPMAIILFILACLLLANFFTSFYFLALLLSTFESSDTATSLSKVDSLHTFFKYSINGA